MANRTLASGVEINRNQRYTHRYSENSENSKILE